jgi:prephenate dehydrogenase
MVDTLSKTNFVDEIFHYAAGGFRDLSRIASSDPTMWRDICLENKTAILEMIDAYQNALDEIKGKIQSDDAAGLFEVFDDAKTTRDQHVASARPVEAR